MFLLQIAIVRILYMADATLPSSSFALASASALPIAVVVVLVASCHIPGPEAAPAKSRRKNAQRGIYWRQVLAIVSPQINFRTKIGLHFRRVEKTSTPFPPSPFWFLRDAHKAMNFFIRFKFFFRILLVFYFLLFNLTVPQAGRGSGSESFFPALYFFTRFLVL